MAIKSSNCMLRCRLLREEELNFHQRQWTTHLQALGFHLSSFSFPCERTAMGAASDLPSRWRHFSGVPTSQPVTGYPTQSTCAGSRPLDGNLDQYLCLSSHISDVSSRSHQCLCDLFWGHKCARRVFLHCQALVPPRHGGGDVTGCAEPTEKTLFMLAPS